MAAPTLSPHHPVTQGAGIFGSQRDTPRNDGRHHKCTDNPGGSYQQESDPKGGQGGTGSSEQKGKSLGVRRPYWRSWDSPLGHPACLPTSPFPRTDIYTHFRPEVSSTHHVAWPSPAPGLLVSRNRRSRTQLPGKKTLGRTWVCGAHAFPMPRDKCRLLSHRL